MKGGEQRFRQPENAPLAVGGHQRYFGLHAKLPAVGKQDALRNDKLARLGLGKLAVNVQDIAELGGAAVADVHAGNDQLGLLQTAQRHLPLEIMPTCGFQKFKIAGIVDMGVAV